MSSNEKEERKRIVYALAECVAVEVLRASDIHEPMHSPHEGKAVIEEELDELWDEIKADRGRTFRATKEALQVSAMGLRYVLDLIPRDTLVDAGFIGRDERDDGG